MRFFFLPKNHYLEKTVLKTTPGTGKDMEIHFLRTFLKNQAKNIIHRIVLLEFRN